MATELFQEAEIARKYQRYRIDYVNTHVDEEILSFLRQQLPQGVNSTAVDVACGTGFLSRVLAPSFASVIGVDCSEAQLMVAREYTNDKNIAYRVGYAEDLHFISSNSVNLVTVAVAIFYLDAEKFYAEVERILKPGGVVALINMDHRPGEKVVTLTPSIDDPEIITGCQNLFDEIRCTAEKMTGNGVQRMYATGLPDSPPGSYEHHHFEFPAEKVGNIDTFVGFVGSLGGMRAYMKAYPDRGDMVEVYKGRLLALLGEVSTSPEKTHLSVGSQFQCHMYRKPLLTQGQ